MRYLLTALFFALVAAGPARAQDQTIEQVITQQLEAFRASDVTTAFSFASPMIQGMFQTPERFGAMVQNGYPMVWRPAEVDFVDQVQDGSMVVQRLRIRDRMGQDHWFGYEMVLYDGAWRINGVYPIEALNLGV